MPRLSELPAYEPIAGLIYGASRSGKTFLCGTLGSRTAWVNIGLGIATIKSSYFRNLIKSQTGEDFNPLIETVTEDSIPDKPDGYTQVCNLVESFLEMKDIDHIVIDDLTQLRRMGMTEAMEVNEMLGKSQSLKESKRVKALSPAIQDYGQEMSLTQQFCANYIRDCKVQGKNLFLTAHERKFLNPASRPGGEETVRKITPGFTGKTHPDEVTGLFDFVWHMESFGAGERIKYYAITEGDSAVQAGTRYPKIFPSRWENPNLLKAVEAIKKGEAVK